jgi:hypothetical protein
MVRTSVAVMAAGLALLGGCTSPSGSPTTTAPSTSAAPAPNPSDASAIANLNAAIAKTRAGSYHTDLTVKSASSNLAIAGSVDPAAKAVEVSMNSQGSALTVRLIGTDMYFTGLDNVVTKGKWIHADISKLPGVEGILDSFEQTFALSAGMVDLKEGPAGTFTGHVDPQAALDKATTDAAKSGLSKIISAGSAGPLPFTAKVVGGYVVEISTTYKMEQNGTVEDATIDSKMSQFGKVAKITAPPKADVVDAA